MRSCFCFLCCLSCVLTPHSQPWRQGCYQRCWCMFPADPLQSGRDVINRMRAAGRCPALEYHVYPNTAHSFLNALTPEGVAFLGSECVPACCTGRRVTFQPAQTQAVTW